MNKKFDINDLKSRRTDYKALLLWLVESHTINVLVLGYVKSKLLFMVFLTKFYGDREFDVYGRGREG